MEIGLKNYDFGAKRKWRKQIWNEIIKRITVPKGEAVVLYLPGPDDEDGKIATSKGFKRRNLIAVDLNEENIFKIRAKGGFGICGDLESVLEAWTEPKIDVVVADFCGGLSMTMITKFPMILAHSPGIKDIKKAGDSRCVVMVNLMRGRDAETNIFRKNNKVNTKHRGQHFMDMYYGMESFLLFHYCMEYNRLNDIFKGGDFVGKKDALNGIARLFANNGGIPDDLFNGDEFNWDNGKTFKEVNPVYLSYKSISRVYMDSVVFSHCGYFPVEYSKYDSSKQTKRLIAATKAIRTMNMMK